MATTGGEDWSRFYELVQLTGEWRGGLFVFYISFYVVAAVNIITGTFVDKAFRIAQPDLDQLVLENENKIQECIEDLGHVWVNVTQKDLHGQISFEAARELIEGPWAHILQARGIEMDD